MKKESYNDVEKRVLERVVDDAVADVGALEFPLEALHVDKFSE